jgi:hypothetical protein
MLTAMLDLLRVGQRHQPEMQDQPLHLCLYLSLDQSAEQIH